MNAKSNKWYVEEHPNVDGCFALCHRDVKKVGHLCRIFGTYKTKTGAERIAKRFNQEGVTMKQAADMGR